MKLTNTATRSGYMPMRGAQYDPVKYASAINLVHVSDSQQGIQRQKVGKGFRYTFKGEKITDKEILLRIKALVIPPAWKNVWICTRANGHLQATGSDVKNRKQYRYHTAWSEIRNLTKFHRLQEFGNALSEVRQRINRDLALPGLPQQKVLAIIVSLMQHSGARPGHSYYEKQYGSYGLTTLKDKHVTILGSEIRFCFKGKKGIEHKFGIRNKRLARLVRHCKEIPGKELFQYLAEDGSRHSVDSGMVNQYVKEITGKDFTAKEFRTWIGTVKAISAFREIAAEDAQPAKSILAVFDRVAAHLGNTRAVCKKYYVHPIIVQLHEEGRLEKYLNARLKTDAADVYSAEEKILLRILGAERKLAA